jgi:hypothetical protein
VNCALLLMLWAAVLAEVLGFEHDEALTLGRAVAGLNAYSKGVSLELFQPTLKEVSPDQSPVPHPGSGWRKIPITTGQGKIYIETPITAGLKPKRKGQIT